MVTSRIAHPDAEGNSRERGFSNSFRLDLVSVKVTLKHGPAKMVINKTGGSLQKVQRTP